MTARLLKQLIALPDSDLTTLSDDGRLNPVPLAEERTFYHSGDLGDIIYSLPTIRALGGGRLFIGPMTRYATRQKANPAMVRFLQRLLTLQPYITSVEYSEPRRVVYDLNRFRDYLVTEPELIARGEPRRSLAEAHLLTFRQPLHECHKPWLCVDRATLTDRPVLVHRSARWQNPQFPWNRVMELHANRAAFIGLKSEYEDFVNDFGELPYFPVEDLLDMARLIAGCRLFVGNQSLPYALAAGMHKDSLLEVWPMGPNCRFPRTNALHGEGKIVYIPQLELDVPPLPRNRCPMCHSPKQRPDHHPCLVECLQCGISYLLNPPTEATLARQCQIAPCTPGSHLSIPDRVADIKTSPLRREPFMQALSHWSTKGKLLDIGAGWGAFADHARERGFEPTTCEIAASSANFCHSVLGIPVLDGDFCRVVMQCERWDVITLLHTLEHLRDPKLVLEKVHDLLKPGGIFAGIVPNYRSLCSEALRGAWPWLDLQEHITYLGPSSLYRLLELNRFKVLQLSTCLGDFPQDLASACATKQGLTPDKIVENKLGEEIWFFALKL
jgi:SAM-dependent methyltransferase